MLNGPVHAGSGATGTGSGTLLLRNVVEGSHSRKALPLTITAILLGAGLCDLMDWALFSKPGHPAYPDFTQGIYFGLIILMVVIRFRQHPAGS